MDEIEYIRKVDREVQQLRAQKLGQCVSFVRVWPGELSQERQREWLADRLLFALAELCPDRTVKSELDRSWEWLYEMICYLCNHCDEADWTFGSLFRLKELPQAVREDIVVLHVSTLELYRAFRSDPVPPKVLGLLEAAVVRVTGVVESKNA